ncbi:MAG: hypothetical protein C4519_06360 [Desulfobacteraceae bacterium]|nr:MAG: hypothetical protein C4519_06360 [Desulfobacteraceae bacterium]
MTRKDSRRFIDKHPQGTQVSPELRQAVLDHITDHHITCEAAHRIAMELKNFPRQIGVAIDLQEARIRGCQLGLFGHGPMHKKILPAEQVAPQLKAAIEDSLVDGRLSCAQAWRIADAAGLPRMTVAEACEKLKIKINKCQLGAF